MTTLYLVLAPIPEIGAEPGDILADPILEELTLLRRLGVNRSLLAFRAAALKPLGPGLSIPPRPFGGSPGSMM